MTHILVWAVVHQGKVQHESGKSESNIWERLTLVQFSPEHLIIAIAALPGAVDRAYMVLAWIDINRCCAVKSSGDLCQCDF